MTSEASEHGPDDHACSDGNYETYEASVASTAPSSQASVFSDTLSAQSSIATSISDDFRSSHEDAHEQDRICAAAQLRYVHGNTLPERSSLAGGAAKAPFPSYADVTTVPAPHKLHPRRGSLTGSREPPPLIRQRDRKNHFVDNLVDSASQMIEVIWPLSVAPCRSEGSGRGVLPLRTYIEETLKRSRTSYSTLQVALYYLILIRPHVPKTDFTMEQTVDCPADRSLMCGRRMFLAALILASKYLQDRNYSAKAWSKMSGLKVCEINMNERMYLSKINWKLHISQPTFEKWQELVLRFSPTPCPPGGGATVNTWKQIVPILTPELETFACGRAECKALESHTGSYGLSSPTTPTPTKYLGHAHMDAASQESTPTPSTILPRFLEPRPDIQPPTPALARMGPLPTPNMTPSSIASNAPAASVCGSRRPSMCSAMATAQRNQFSRCIIDAYHGSTELRASSRRPSMMNMESYGSSPESMMTDRSTSSRASSTSSMSTVSTNASLAPQRACLARQATCCNVRLPPLRLVKEEKEGTCTKPIIIDDDVEMVSSPITADFSVSEKALHAPHRHSRASKNVLVAATTSSSEKTRKRGRTNGNRRSELQEEVRYLLEESFEDEMDLDDTVASSPETANYASNMLAQDYSIKQAQRPVMYARRELRRVPVQKDDGRKRFCGFTKAISVSPVPLYGEVV
ncbi:hypothetical protein DOTSEDRAFT_68437 [Dothistroma septosporum NZE10]|uniref:Cyclin N-terminal domain-containing protein n=1 Tax=Dothistroma septosporum (strain NZE10 / CBS 128990) TaxID=675120 RepID=N1Q4S0_DOTSN|nr:hypothetical protein DOTSEDRAFT_68437 [Dothistroma septosporum NZE10]